MSVPRRGLAVLALLLALLSSLAQATLTEASLQTAESCPASPSIDMFDGVAPVTGEWPIWHIDGSGGVWSELPTKTAWVIARDQPGSDLVVTGRRLGYEETLRFMPGVSAPHSDALVIKDVERLVMMPDLPPDAFERYRFHGSYVVYPGPGCWELTARIGSHEVRSVHLIKLAVSQ